MSIKEKQEELIADFQGLEDWMDRYALIIEMGNELPEMPEKYRVPGNLIEGCQSRVWIYPEEREGGRMHMVADSDALIVKGIVAMLLRILNDEKARDIAQADLYFIEKLELYDHLSPTRSNGLAAMLKQIKLFALARAATAKE